MDSYITPQLQALFPKFYFEMNWVETFVGSNLANSGSKFGKVSTRDSDRHLRSEWV